MRKQNPRFSYLNLSKLLGKEVANGLQIKHSAASLHTRFAQTKWRINFKHSSLQHFFHLYFFCLFILKCNNIAKEQDFNRKM